MNALTNTQRKLYASLATAKGRRQSSLFMAQGTKCVLDTLGHFRVKAVLATQAWADEHERSLQPDLPLTVVKTADLERISTLQSPPQVIAVYHIPTLPPPRLHGELVLALDCVQDPGNLGTIMRVADWMGVDTILASPDTADVWSPKVVQATMGAISRVRVHYLPLPETLAAEPDTTVYGTFLDGDCIYDTDLHPAGVIVMGNEGRGISPEVAECVNRRIHIPSYPPGHPTSESLNVAVATAITLAEFRRRQI